MHLWRSLWFIPSENLWQLKSLSGLVAEKRSHPSAGRREEENWSRTAVTCYIQTFLFLIQLKTAVKNTVLHKHLKDHIFYTLYIFVQYDTVAENLFFIKSSFTEQTMNRWVWHLQLKVTVKIDLHWIVVLINTLKGFLWDRQGTAAVSCHSVWQWFHRSKANLENLAHTLRDAALRISAASDLSWAASLLRLDWPVWIWQIYTCRATGQRFTSAISGYAFLGLSSQIIQGYDR